MENYLADAKRYENGMQYERCGRSGVLLPKVSLGMWHNFGSVDPYERSREIVRYAFDHGVTHLDLANNYGPAPGSAEETLGRIMDDDLRPYRDELFISTKAGYGMWAGPYGDWGSRKYLMASLDQSLKRMHLDYVDLFYSHRYDPNTPLEETLQTLVDVVRAGKALYVGISNWPLEALRFGIEYLKRHDTPLLIYQGKLNMLHKAPIEEGILQLCHEAGVGFFPYVEGCFPARGNAHSRTVGTVAPMERRGTKERREPCRKSTRLDIGTGRSNIGTRRSQLNRAIGPQPESRQIIVIALLTPSRCGVPSCL